MDLVTFDVHQHLTSIFFCTAVCVCLQVTWLKDGKFISLRDRLYTQTKKRLRGNSQGQDQDPRDDQLVASLFVASVRTDATFTCRIETNPPDEQSMQIAVRGEPVLSDSFVTTSLSS